MKSLAFFVGLLIVAIGLVGFIAPGVLVTILGHFVTSTGLYVAAAVRIAIGVVLLGAASTSRFPKTFRVFGILAVVFGLATPLVGVERAQALMNWWSAEAPLSVRLWALVAVAVGGFILYAFSGGRRAV